MSAAQKKTKPNSDGFGFGKSDMKKGSKKDSSKTTARAALITVTVVIVLALGAFFVNTNYVRQNFAAVTVDNVKYSVTDFNYYFQNVYQQYQNAVNGMGDYGSSLLPTRDTSLKSQIYDEKTGQTWADFFGDMVIQQMKDDTKIWLDAKQAGFNKLPDDEQKKMDDQIESLKTMAYSSGYTNFGDYLKAAYGKSMDEATYRKNVERTYLVSWYTNYKHDNFEYTPEQIESYYNENKDTFDTFTYRYFLVASAKVEETDYPDDASYQAANNAAIEAAGVKANEYAAKITDKQSFIDAAREYDPETYKEDSASERVYKGELLGGTYGDWLRDASRQYGNVSTFKTTTGYYVVMFESRDNNHYPTVNVQQIFVKQAQVDQANFTDDTTGEKFNEAVANAKKTAEDAANSIYKEWTDAGATQDKLVELTKSHSTEINTEGSKLNENIYKGQMAADVNSWIYDPARKAGDHTLIYVDSVGYYILSFVGPGEQYSDVLAKTQKRDKDLQAWKDSLTSGEARKTWLMAMTM